MYFKSYEDKTTNLLIHIIFKLSKVQLLFFVDSFQIIIILHNLSISMFNNMIGKDHRSIQKHKFFPMIGYITINQIILLIYNITIFFKYLFQP